MAEELTYTVVTPYTIRKSRTGSVLARLLGRTSAELIAAQVFALNRDEAEAYALTIRPGLDERDEAHRAMIRGYIRQNFGPASDGRRHRCLLLVFRGQNAHQDVADVVGRIHISSLTGETIRDTYGDMVYNEDGSIRYFEPAVLTPDSAETAVQDLHFWMGLSRRHPALLENVCVYDDAETVERTLVVIKPDCWRERSSRPGSILDMFSRTGLRIIAMKLCRMTVRQGLEFYGPVRDILRARLAPGIGQRAKVVLEKELGFTLAAGVGTLLSESVGIPFAENQFEKIIEFMTGRRPDQCNSAELDAPSKVKCLALVYEGPHAVRRIRDVLGPTDPLQAPGGTVRREFGSDVMVNTAHASDSVANAVREMAILDMAAGNLGSILPPALRELGRADCLEPHERRRTHPAG